MTPRFSFAQIGENTIHYHLSDYTDPWRSDAPQTLLLYPGYCRNIEFWRAWVPLLGRDYRVLRMDARGYGHSSKPAAGAPLSVEALASDALGLMDHLGIDKVHWVGESTGGAVGLQAAALHPERIHSVILSNTTARMRTETPGNYAVGESDQAAALEKYGVAEWCRKTLNNRMDVKRAPPGLGDWVAEQMARTPVHIAIAAFRLFSKIDLFPLLARVRAPTLLIAGNNTTESRKKIMTAMRETIPTAKLVYLDGVDYGLHYVAPDEVVAAVRKFLDEYFPRTSVVNHKDPHPSPHFSSLARSGGRGGFFEMRK
jgi:3-oxoadipate enol-lactonase